MGDVFRRRIDRPIGVIVISFLTLLWGIMLFAATFQGIRESPEIPFAYTVVSLALPAFLAASAVWAFTGQNEGCFALIIVLVLNWVWPMHFAVSALMDSDPGNDERGVSLTVGLVLR